MNLNNLAKTITLQEGGKKSLGIGQVKETMRITLTELAALPEQEALKVIRRYRSKARGATVAGSMAKLNNAMRSITASMDGATRASKTLATEARKAARRVKR